MATPGTALPPALEAHTLLVAAIIVHDEAQQRVLLIRRGRQAKFAPDHWDLPVGKSAKGEVITQTAVRELKEETGLVVDPTDLRVAGLIHCSWGVEAPNGFVTVVFITSTWSGDPLNAEPHKHGAVAWHSVNQVPEEFVSTTRTALINYLNSGPMVTTEGF